MILVDTSPDLREQLIDAGVRRIDAVLYTHSHADHTHGIDDLRPLVIHNGRRIPAFMDEATRRALTQRFDYVFATPPGSCYPPMMNARELEAQNSVTIEGPGGPICATPFRLEHGDMESLGFRFEADHRTFAYTPDMNAIPPESVECLAGLDLWIIDALRHQRHGTHFSVSEAFAWIERMKPRRAVLTDLHTDLDYAALAEICPPATEPAFDGMQVRLD